MWNIFPRAQFVFWQLGFFPPSFVSSGVNNSFDNECNSAWQSNAAQLWQPVRVSWCRWACGNGIKNHSQHTQTHTLVTTTQLLSSNEWQGGGGGCECFCSEGFIVSQFRYLFFVASPVLFTLALPGLIFMGAGRWFIVGLSSFVRTGMMSGLAGSSVVPLFTR